MKAKYGLQVNHEDVLPPDLDQPLLPISYPPPAHICNLLFPRNQSNEYEEAKALRNPKYKDRAESRRQTVGSEGVFQQDDAPASVHV